MDITNAALLAITHGFTECFPVSSSLHVKICAILLNDKNHILLTRDMLINTILIYAHFGSLLALLVYFRQTIFALFNFKTYTQNPTLAHFIVATIPVAIVGFILNKLYYMERIVNFISKIIIDSDKTFISQESLQIVITSIIGVIASLILYGFDRKNNKLTFKCHKNLQSMSFCDAIIIGVTQCFGLITGFSRLGASLIGCRALGYSREDSVKFSMILGIGAIFGATVLKTYELYKTNMLGVLSQIDFEFLQPYVTHFEQTTSLQFSFIFIVILSFCVTLITIPLSIRILSKYNFLWIVIYRILCAVYTVVLIY
jgi:undecaprenyl-diphosphatase